MHTSVGWEHFFAPLRQQQWRRLIRSLFASMIASML